MSEADDTSTALDTTPTEAAATLVPLDDDGSFLVFGRLPESLQLDVEPVPYLREEQVRTLADTLASSAGIGNVLAQGWNAYQGSAGLVRLAPQTLAAMKAGATPLTQGGWALGTLTKGGKFAAQVRWAPAGAAGVGAGLATLGPALALVAVQWQMNKIGKAVERNIELTRTVLDELREEAWYELDAVARIVLSEVQAAQAVGEVTDLMWNYLQAQSTEPILVKHRQRNRDALSRKLESLKFASKPEAWYREHAADVLRHCQAVMTAQQAIALHHILRVAHARRSGEDQDQALATHVLEKARVDHEAIAADVHASLRTLYRALSLSYDADPGRRLPIFGRADAPVRELCDAVKELHVRATAGPFRQLPPLTERKPLSIKRVVDVPESERRDIEQRLVWIVDEDESVDLVCRGSYKFADDETRHLLVITGRRALLVDRDDLGRGRANVRELPLDCSVSRTWKDGQEVVTLDHDGPPATLRTRAADSVVYSALRELQQKRESQIDLGLGQLLTG